MFRTYLQFLKLKLSFNYSITRQDEILTLNRNRKPYTIILILTQKLIYCHWKLTFIFNIIIMLKS